MHLSQRQWKDLVGVGACGCGESGFVGADDETGAFFDTDVENYADRVNAVIMQLDRDLRPVFEGRAPGEIGQAFRDDWDSFMGDPTLCEAIVNEKGEVEEGECLDYDAEAQPYPTGWTSYKAHIGTGRLITLAGNKDSALRHIGNYERAYGDFRNQFIQAGGKTEAPQPKHPGVFETLEEQEKRKAGETDFGTLAKIGLVLLGLGVVGYTITGVARLKGS